MLKLRPVVLSGGSGTRLWPISTSQLPKQFVPLIDGHSLFALTTARLDGLGGVVDPIIVTGSRHVGLVEDALADWRAHQVIVEPIGRNTAPAAIAAGLAADPDDILVILPSDHIVTDLAAFHGAVEAAADAASHGAIVTFGVEPTRPETGYGYIEVGEERGGAFVVTRFKEKPTIEEAGRLAGDGRHFWNSGMFVVEAGKLLASAGALCPELLDGVRRAMPDTPGRRLDLGDSFAGLEAISFDYAIMEKTPDAVVIPLHAGWSDIGSFRSLLEVTPRDGHGNHAEGDVLVRDVHGSYVKATSRKVVVVGLEEVAVVETPDAVLVLPLDRSQDVRQIRAEVDPG